MEKSADVRMQNPIYSEMVIAEDDTFEAKDEDVIAVDQADIMGDPLPRDLRFQESLLLRALV